MTGAAVVSAIYGRFDHPQRAPRSCPAFLFTESQRTAFEAEQAGWEVIIRPVPDGQTPRMASKWPKMHPLEALPDHPLQVWVDGSMACLDAIVELFEFAPLAAWRHPWNHDLRAEAAEASLHPKYQGYDLAGQVAVYEAAGHPADWGLWENGVHVRDLRDDRVRDMFADWADEVKRWGPECQISLPYVARRHGLRPIDLPYTLRQGNPWVVMAPHLRGD